MDTTVLLYVLGIVLLLAFGGFFGYRDGKSRCDPEANATKRYYESEATLLLLETAGLVTEQDIESARKLAHTDDIEQARKRHLARRNP